MAWGNSEDATIRDLRERCAALEGRVRELDAELSALRKTTGELSCDEMDNAAEGGKAGWKKLSEMQRMVDAVLRLERNL